MGRSRGPPRRHPLRRARYTWEAPYRRVMCRFEGAWTAVRSSRTEMSQPLLAGWHVLATCSAAKSDFFPRDQAANIDVRHYIHASAHVCPVALFKRQLSALVGCLTDIGKSRRVAARPVAGDRWLWLSADCVAGPRRGRHCT